MFLVRCMATAMRRPAQKANIPQYFRFLEAPHLGIFRSRLDQHLFPWPTLFCKPGACSFLGGSSPWGPLSRSRGPEPACVLRQLLLLQLNRVPALFQMQTFCRSGHPGCPLARAWRWLRAWLISSASCCMIDDTPEHISSSVMSRILPIKP